MESEGLWLCSKEPATGPSPEPDRILPLYFFKNPFKYWTPEVSKMAPSVQIKNFMHFSSPYAFDTATQFTRPP
jgi:hypothetical protein